DFFWCWPVKNKNKKSDKYWKLLEIRENIGERVASFDRSDKSVVVGIELLKDLIKYWKYLVQ
ncbi:unnamed protein product, partial [marine sediment metagenome]